MNNWGSFSIVLSLCAVVLLMALSQWNATGRDWERFPKLQVLAVAFLGGMNLINVLVHWSADRSANYAIEKSLQGAYELVVSSMGSLSPLICASMIMPPSLYVLKEFVELQRVDWVREKVPVVHGAPCANRSTQKMGGSAMVETLGDDLHHMGVGAGFKTANEDPGPLTDVDIQKCMSLETQEMQEEYCRQRVLSIIRRFPDRSLRGGYGFAICAELADALRLWSEVLSQGSRFHRARLSQTSLVTAIVVGLLLMYSYFSVVGNLSGETEGLLQIASAVVVGISWSLRDSISNVWGGCLNAMTTRLAPGTMVDFSPIGEDAVRRRADEAGEEHTTPMTTRPLRSERCRFLVIKTGMLYVTCVDLHELDVREADSAADTFQFPREIHVSNAGLTRAGFSIRWA